MVKSDLESARFHNSWATHGPQVGHGACPSIDVTLAHALGLPKAGTATTSREEL